MDSFIGLLKNGLAILGSYKAVIEYGPKCLKIVKNLTKRKYYDIEEIFPKLKENELALGDIIECSGFLSKYSQTFLPMSFLPSVPGPSSEKILKRTFENGK
ncbi:hypothetical protein N752_11695 [Desulforamulus aquiferis]|nr:hypothetical protein [Desulforamulus aquiferis]RYD05020.1 hypothetical protein N752_11695 [Desulforamulus aquiferis]